MTEILDTKTYAYRRYVEGRLMGLRTNRYSWWVHWKELADYFLPRRYKWLITPNQMSRDRRSINISSTRPAASTPATLPLALSLVILPDQPLVPPEDRLYRLDRNLACQPLAC